MASDARLVPQPARRPSPALYLAVIGVVGLLIAGMVLSRPDMIAVAVAPALWAAHALARPTDSSVRVSIERVAEGATEQLREDIVVHSGAEIVELAVIQAERRHRRLFLPGRARVRANTRPLHSGPLCTVEVAPRELDADGGLLGAPQPAVSVVRGVPPVARKLPRVPHALRLTGLHGAHEGVRPGHGGDFRDIHPFAPGDELRRVDWRATARAARRPGELLIRRTHALSDASAVIVMDTADDLGTVVATWGTDSPERSGITSLDHARSAARSIAEGVIAHGDRVAFHTLAQGGRSVRSGGGSRHLARLVAEIAASGRAGDDTRFRRTPPVPHGSIIHVLSTFFDGAAAEIAVRWRASGHRVVAVDVLPELDRHRLSDERRLALEVLLLERDDMLHGLTESGVEIVRWADDPDGALALLSRGTGRGGTGRIGAGGVPR